ncbi:MAG: sugar phosphate isomerase/epimerase [Kiritimatiellia bacterium]|jgi:sugar phosphate isomerase/epimerase|nr:sugar phosphate isomerase/epimerase [Kiritimatiellia bacterium]
MTTRRSFFKQAGIGTAAWAGACGLAAGCATAPRIRPTPAASTDPFRLGIAGYTFHKFTLTQTLEMLRKIDVRFLCIKDFHLPLASTEQEIADFHETCRTYGVTGYGVGPIYMSTDEEVDAAFAYAKRVGTRTLVGVPYDRDGKKRVASARVLRRVQDRVREHDICFAIHNHGPDMPELFPTAESAMGMIADLDPRIGLCLDIGHQYRDGKDPVQALLRYADRVYDIHIKNVTAADKSGKGIEMPRGRIDLPAFVRALRAVRYAGVCSLEYEKDMADPFDGIAESIGYFRGVTDATR